METESTRNNFNYTSVDGSIIIPKPDITANESANADSIKISGKYISWVIAKEVDVASKDFDRYNPGFDDILAAGADYTMRLPVDKMKVFAEKKYSILNDCIQQLLSEASIPPDNSKKKNK